VLTWVSIYWFSLAEPAASVRIYYELVKAGETIYFPKTTVPVGVSFFPKEIVRLPRAYVFTSHTRYEFFLSSAILTYCTDGVRID